MWSELNLCSYLVHTNTGEEPSRFSERRTIEGAPDASVPVSGSGLAWVSLSIAISSRYLLTDIGCSGRLEDSYDENDNRISDERCKSMLNANRAPAEITLKVGAVVVSKRGRPPVS